MLAEGGLLSFSEGPHRGKLPQTKEGRNSTIGETQVEDKEDTHTEESPFWRGGWKKVYT